MIKWLALEWQAHMLWLAHSYSWYNVGLHLNGIQPYKEWHINQEDRFHHCPPIVELAKSHSNNV